MQARRVSVGGLVTSIVLASVFAESTYAESTPEQDRQQMEQMMEMMKNSGADPSQLEQIEAMMRGGMETGIRQKEDRIEADRDEFAENFGSEVNAWIKINGRRYDLVVTTCEWIDEKTKHFGISAEAPPGGSGASLTVDGGGRHGSQKLYFWTPSGDIDGQNLKLTFDGERFEWSGVIGDMVVAVDVNCD
jgi:hypothetical protein